MFPIILVNEIFKTKNNTEFHFKSCILNGCDSVPKWKNIGS